MKAKRNHTLAGETEDRAGDKITADPGLLTATVIKATVFSRASKEKENFTTPIDTHLH